MEKYSLTVVNQTTENMSQRSSQVLLVGHEPKTLDALSDALREDHIALRLARTAEQAMQFFHDRPAAGIVSAE